MTRWSRLAEARFAGAARRRGRAGRAGRFAGGAPRRAGARRTRRISPSPMPAPGHARSGLLCGAAVRRHRRRRRLLAPVPGGARGARPRLFGLVVAAALSRCRPLLFLRRDGAARGGGRLRPDRRGRRRRGRDRDPARAGAGAGPGQGRPADVARKPPGARPAMSPASSRINGRLVEPAEVVARARGGDARPGPRGRREDARRAARRARRSACRRCAPA